jgi:thiamine pyrophosphokinase
MMRALLWLNADGPSDELIARLIEGADIVAGVDGGSDRAVSSGFEIDLIIGDMDSVELQDSAALRVPLEDQQSSDLAKAIEYLYGKGYEEFDVVGIEGGLESHQLGIWGALAEAPGDVGITLHSDRSEIHRISPKAGQTLVEVPIGSEFSVFALENCDSVTVIGGKWGLNGESLRLSTRGLHNIAEASTISFSSDGVLVAIINR